MKTVKKALAILDLFTKETRSQGVSEIARKLGIHKSSSHALLTTLKEEGYLIYDPETKKYYLGYKPIDLAERVQYRNDIKEITLPFMKELSAATQEDVSLNVLIEGRRVCIALVESQCFVRALVPIGKGLPIHCSAAGKVLVAYLSEDKLQEILRRHGLPRFTPNTITDKERLLIELDKIRNRGYGESREEFSKEAAALAFPIFNKKGIIASISIQSTVSRLNRKTRPEFVHQGLAITDKINRFLSER